LRGILISKFDKQKILIRTPNWLGDVMMSLPALQLLLQSFPNWEISVLTQPSYISFFKCIPHLKEILSFNPDYSLKNQVKSIKKYVQKYQFNTILVFPLSFSSAWLAWRSGIKNRIGYQSELRSWLLTKSISYKNYRTHHLVYEYLDLVIKAFDLRTKLVNIGYLKEVFNSRQFKFILDKFELSKNEWIALVPGATYGPTKRWPLSRWKKLTQNILKTRTENIIILGSGQEVSYFKEFYDEVDTWELSTKSRIRFLVGQTTVLELAVILSNCKLLISNDTGSMHVASAIQIPTIALFGSTNPNWTGPWGGNDKILYHKIPCSPCFKKKCLIQDKYKCLYQITEEEVMESIKI
jgi:heptosyltransferase-2